MSELPQKIENKRADEVATELAELTGGQFTPHQIMAMKRANIIPAQAKRPDLELFLFACNATGANPIIKQAYLISRNQKKRDQYGKLVEHQGKHVWEVAFYTVFDYKFLMAKCDETGEWGGHDAPLFNGNMTLAQMKAAGQAQPETVSVTVYRWKNGQKDATTAEASWQEYGGKGPLWQNHPFTMLTKVAMRKAVTGAFPAATQGMHIVEEYDGEESEPGTVIQNQSGQIIQELPPAELFYEVEAATEKNQVEEIAKSNVRFMHNAEFSQAVAGKIRELEGGEK